MKTVKALLFDLDGTLIDSKQDITESVRYVQHGLGVRMSEPEEVATFIGDGVNRLMERALRSTDAALIKKSVEIFKDHYREHCLDHTVLYPGVREALDHFKSKAIAVVTNKPTRISLRIIQGLGIGPYFKTVVGGDSVLRKKPDPEPVQLALKILNSLRHPGEAVMIGDSLNDVLSGRAAGTITCGIRSEIGDPNLLLNTKPDFLLESLAELPRLFA